MTVELQAEQSCMAGAAVRISAAEKEALALQAQPAFLRATIHIRRAATGAVETVELRGVIPESPTKEQ